jgi:ATP-dependent DNA ligase
MPASAKRVRSPAPANLFSGRLKFVAEIGFSEWTQNGLLRQPRIEGLREDKPARQVRRERPTVSGTLVTKRG